MIITDPLFYVIAVPVVLLTGFSKTGIPGLFGGMAVPLLSLVISPLQAAAIMLPVLCFIDLFGLRAFWGVYDRRNLPILLAGLASASSRAPWSSAWCGRMCCGWSSGPSRSRSR